MHREALQLAGAVRYKCHGQAAQSIYVIPSEQFIYVIPTAVEGSPAVGSEPLDLVGAVSCRRQRKEILRLRSG